MQRASRLLCLAERAAASTSLRDRHYLNKAIFPDSREQERRSSAALKSGKFFVLHHGINSVNYPADLECPYLRELFKTFQDFLRLGDAASDYHFLLFPAQFRHLLPEEALCWAFHSACIEDDYIRVVFVSYRDGPPPLQQPRHSFSIRYIGGAALGEYQYLQHMKPAENIL